MSESNKDKKPEFLAALKLVSGEEILSMVTHVQDVNGDYLIVEPHTGRGSNSTK